METMSSIRCLRSKSMKRRLRFFKTIQKTSRSKVTTALVVLAISSSLSFCKQESNCHDEMIFILEQYDHEPYSHRNQLYPKVEFPHTNSPATVPFNIRSETRLCKCLKVHLLMKLGQKEEAIKILEDSPKVKDKVDQHISS